ncbi:MAG: hypothetical protein M3R46_11885 [Actinomycetota bacterium]|nr:hypothetical protein [Actinomycetota bacterium]
MPADLDDLLLVLIDLVYELKLAVTARARIGQRNPDLLIDMVGNRPVGFLPYCSPLLRPDRAGSFLGSPLENGAA